MSLFIYTVYFRNYINLILEDYSYILADVNSIQIKYFIILLKKSNTYITLIYKYLFILQRFDDSFIMRDTLHTNLYSSNYNSLIYATYITKYGFFPKQQIQLKIKYDKELRTVINQIFQIALYHEQYKKNLAENHGNYCLRKSSLYIVETMGGVYSNNAK